MSFRFFRMPTAAIPGTARPATAMAAIAMATVAAMALAGCAGKTPAASSSPEKPDLAVGAVPAADSVGLYIAQQKGLFAAQGLHVKIIPVTSSATAVSDQLAGRYDVTIGNYVS